MKESNDTFLKVFDQNIQDSGLKPKNSNILESKAELFLNHENYNFDTGLIVYENLQKKVVIGTNMYCHIIIITKYFLKIFFMEA